MGLTGTKISSGQSQATFTRRKRGVYVSIMSCPLLDFVLQFDHHVILFLVSIDDSNEH